MAQVPRRYIDNYTKALNKLSADAQAKLAADLAKIDFLADVAAVRDAIIDRMELYCGPYTDMAAILAAEFYDGLREQSVGAKLGAYAESGREPIATEKAVRGIMQDVVEGKAAEMVVRKLTSRVDYEVKRAAGECVYRNGERDPLKPKYARVPSGGETCAFCIMLASRGFVYRSADAAGENGHYHANCDCRIVPGFEGAESSVKGYDPDRYYDMWKHPEKYANQSALASDGASEKFLHKDQDVLSGVKRGREMSFEEADGNRVNPHYEDGLAYQINCQSCVVAYEARRRGFDVEVLPYDKNGKSRDLAKRTELAWCVKGTNKAPAPIRDENALTPKRFRKLMEDTVKPNERYHLRFEFNGGGHIVTAERDSSGELMIYDPQSGRIRKGKEIDAYLKQFKYRYTSYGTKMPNPPEFLRVDNLDFNKEYAGAVVKEAGYDS